MSDTKLCKTCLKRIAKSEFEWHKLHGHDMGGVFDRPLDDDYIDDGIVTADYLQPNLDASKNIGYPCRESGAYGSYSSMDGFDDESES